jgi:hypothetical protein
MKRFEKDHGASWAGRDRLPEPWAAALFFVACTLRRCGFLTDVRFGTGPSEASLPVSDAEAIKSPLCGALHAGVGQACLGVR